MKKPRKLQSEIVKAVLSSNNIRECINSLYENKNVSTKTYEMISRIMIEWNVCFKNGTTYIHPNLKEYKEKFQNQTLKVSNETE